MDKKSLQHKKNDRDKILKDLKDNLAMESLYRVQDQMLEQAQGFCPNISFTVDKLDPF